MNETKTTPVEEKILTPKSGMATLLLSLGGFVLAIGLIIFACNMELIETVTAQNEVLSEWNPIAIALILMSSLVIMPVCFVNLFGLKALAPNEALVLTLFGNYYGTLNKAGFYYVNPFCSSYNPTKAPAVLIETSQALKQEKDTASNNKDRTSGKKISLKSITLNNRTQKVNDLEGNPIEIACMVIWRVVSPTAAVFTVDNYLEFISLQSDSTLRNVACRYAYDDDGNDATLTLRGNSEEIAVQLQTVLNQKVAIAGLEVQEVKITHLAYAPEIASAMLQRQQASAILSARRLIVEGAVGMVQQALAKLDSENIVELDDERKATMISNLLVVLCANKEAQPVVNSGSIY